MHQKFSSSVIIYFTATTRSIFQFHHFPKIWKISIISPIPKLQTNLIYPENCWSPSLLNSLSKVNERIIYKRPQNFIDSNDTLTPEIFGFKTQHNTTKLLRRVKKSPSKCVQHRKPTGAIDIAKAFDKVSHGGFISNYFIDSHDIKIVNNEFKFPR
jgi:hypothetical protein